MVGLDGIAGGGAGQGDKIVIGEDCLFTRRCAKGCSQNEFWDFGFL